MRPVEAIAISSLGAPAGGRWALIISNLITGRPDVRSDEWAAAHWME